MTSISGGASSTALYVNNDDSRLNSVLANGPSAVINDYAYDHLGQRILKGGFGYTIFVYDIFGNLISEFDPNGVNIRDWIYLGNNRLAMIQPTQQHLPAFPFCKNFHLPQIDICGLAGWQDGVAL